MRIGFVVIVFSVLFFTCITSAQLSISYERTALANGLQLILHEDHSLPIVAMNLSVHVGSANETPGHTGLAHLFEHIMFEGSGHVPEKKFDQWLEVAGGDNNASTDNDHTKYFENIPSCALELPLFLESDRMGYLLTTMSQAKVDGQRDVVKNERREVFENQPYGMAPIIIDENIYPPDHPYHWPTIGSMDDLTAASYDDITAFFKRYYTTKNVSLVIAGDIDPVKTKELVKKWFSDVPSGTRVAPIAPPTAFLTEEKRIVYEDKVQLPRLYMAWLTPALFKPGDAELDVLGSILAGGKNSRLYKRLVYEMQIAQDVSAFQNSSWLGSEFQIIATARSGHTLTELEEVIQQELEALKNAPPTSREVQRAVNQYEARFLDALESVAGKADRLNEYFSATGNPGYFNEDLSRYKALSPKDIQSVAQTFLRDDGRVVLSIVPEGKEELSASPAVKKGR